MTNDYLVSENGHFFALLQKDGNFCVYRGMGPKTNPDDATCYLWGTQALADGEEFFATMQYDGNFCIYKGTDPSHPGAYVWGTQALADGGQFFAVLQDDGNFCVYKGTGPTDKGALVWQTGYTDSVEDCADIYSIEYDVAHFELVSQRAQQIYTSTLTNETDSQQTSTVTASYSVTETSGWSDALSVKVGVKTNFKSGIPYLAEGKVEVSVDITNTYTWNGSTSHQQTFSFSAPIVVPAHSRSKALVEVVVSTLIVPYTLSGLLVYKSGAHVPGRLKGKYKGTTSGDVKTHLTPVGSTQVAHIESLNVVRERATSVAA